MTGMKRLIMVLLFLPWGSSNGNAGLPPVPSDPGFGDQATGQGSGPHSLFKWSAALASKEFSERQEATRCLLRAREHAIPILQQAARGGHSETIWRAVNILEQMACDVHDVRLRMASLEALRQLQDDTDPRTRRRSASAVKHQFAWRQNHAMASVNRWGGEVRSYRVGDKQSLRVRLDKKWTGGDTGLAELLFVGRVTWMSMETAPVSNEGLQNIQSLVGLERLYLGQTHVTGGGLAYLKNLGNLKHLSLRYLDLNDGSLKDLAPLRNLESLGLDDTPITDTGLIHLAALPQLQRLWLDRTSVSGRGLAYLRGLKELERLYLVETDVQGEGLAELRHLPRLRYLSLKGVAVSDLELSQLSRLEQLQTLGLDATSIKDDQLHHLATLKNLQTLWLSHSKITEQGLKRLESLTQLRQLYVQGIDVSRETTDWFKKVMPECRLYR